MIAQLFRLGGMLILTVASALSWAAETFRHKTVAGDILYRIVLSINRSTDSSALTTEFAYRHGIGR